jgi:hypothetical protein
VNLRTDIDPSDIVDLDRERPVANEPTDEQHAESLDALDCWAPPTPLFCDNCGEPVTIDEQFGRYAHVRTHWVRWSCDSTSGDWASVDGEEYALRPGRKAVA